MQRRIQNIASIVLAVVGIVTVLVSLGADLIGGWPGFGWYQIAGAVVGVVLIFVAWVLMPKTPTVIK